MKNIIKSALLVLALTSGIVSLSAQTATTNPQVTNSSASTITRPVYNAAYYALATNFENATTETATVGAEMPYLVPRSSNVNGAFFYKSMFMWTFTGISTYKLFSGGTLTATDTSDNKIIATMPSSAGSAKIEVVEHSHPRVGPACFDNSTKKEIAITVVTKPVTTVKTASTATGGCGISATYDIACDVSGTAPFYVDYEITAVDLSNAAFATGSTKSYSATIGSDGIIKIYKDQLTETAGSADASGKYTITIKKVWDDVSLKAMNDVSTVPTANNIYDIFSYPVPTTQSLQRVKKQ